MDLKQKNNLISRDSLDILLLLPIQLNDSILSNPFYRIEIKRMFLISRYAIITLNLNAS